MLLPFSPVTGANRVKRAGDTMTGALVITPSSDTTSILKVTNNANTATVLDVDTTNKRVGINVASPTATLDVGGIVLLEKISGSRSYEMYSGTISSDDRLVFTQPSGANTNSRFWYDCDGSNTTGISVAEGGSERCYIGTDLGAFMFETKSTYDLKFRTDSGSERVRIQHSTGNVGINNSNPSELLHLTKATGNFTTIRFDSGNTQGYFFSYDGSPEISIGANTNAPVNIKVNNSTKATFNTSSNLDLVGKVSTYNNIVTSGWGHPTIYGFGRSPAQTGAVASVATYTVGVSDGSFIVSANANVTTFVAGTFNVTVAYTDETNTAQTLKLNFSSLTGTLGIAIAASGPFEGIPAHIRCKASTTITIATSGTFTSLTYNVEGSISQIA